MKTSTTAIDTNILVYAFDTADQKKRKIAANLLKETFEGKRELTLTNQVLAEFVYVVTKKVKNPMSRADAAAIVGSIISSEYFHVRNYDGETVLHAATSAKPFWDALLAQTLKETGTQQLLTENVRDFKESGIKATNPF